MAVMSRVRPPALVAFLCGCLLAFGQDLEKEAAEKWEAVGREFRDRRPQSRDEEIMLYKDVCLRAREWLQKYESTRYAIGVTLQLITAEGALELWEDCLTHIDGLLKRDLDRPTRLGVQHRRIVVLGELGRFEEGLAECDRLLEHLKDDPLMTQRFSLVKATMLMNTASYDDARKICEGLLAEARSDDVKRGAQERLKDLEVLGRPLQDFEDKDLAGRPFSSRTARGRVLLLYFWAQWAGQDPAEFKKLQQTFKDANVTVLTVSLDRDKASVEKFLKDHGIDWPTFCDEKVWMSRPIEIFRVRRIPYTILADENGIVRYLGLRGSRLETAISRLLKKK